MKIAIIIPARFESTRFPGKPLALILGKTMIERVWEICCKVVGPQHVYVATDSHAILKHCESLKIQALMTSSTCLTGTDRVYESSLQLNYDLYVNVQGDEPIVAPDDILNVINCSKKYPSHVICGMGKIESDEQFYSPFVPKVVVDPENELIYMSRAAIPTNKKLELVFAYRQVCIYCFPNLSLKKFYSYGKKSPLEEIEDIEILRFLELKMPIKMVEVSGNSIAVDIPDDISKVEKVLRKLNE